MNRRNILTILGAAAATPALATDNLVRTDFDTEPYRIAKYSPERLATALERLAAEVRANTVNITRFHIGSEIGKDEWLTQTLTIDLEILHDDA